MPVVVDEQGRVSVPSHIATQGLAGRYFARREPTGGPDDLVVAVGAINVGSIDTGPIAELVIATAEWGATPDGWGGSSTTSYGLEQFAEDYREINDAERAVLAGEQATAAAEATKASSDRESPWSRS